MTEPNEPTTPLARMRFSWQRGADVADAPDDDASGDDTSSDEGAADQAVAEPDVAEPGVVEPGVDERAAAAEEADLRTPDTAESAPAARPASDLSATPASPSSSTPADSPAVPPATQTAPATQANGHTVTGDSGPAAASRRASEEARNRLDESRSQPDPDVDDPAWAATDLGELDDAPAEPESRRERKRRERQERKSQAAQSGTDRAADSDTTSTAGAATATATALASRPATRPGWGPVPPPTATGAKRSRRDRGDFDVPAPGRRFSGGRAAHAGLRVALVVTACLLALGAVAYAAFAVGISTGRDNTYRLSAADLARYRLSAFPAAEAGQFAADFARLCFTHDPTPGANDARERQLARYVSGGTDPRCGWNGEGSQSVVDATYTGDSEPIDVPGLQGNARMMTVRVLTDSGSSRIVTVPVYVADLANANGMRIVGDIGEMPQPNLAAAPEVKPPSATDSRLSEALTQGQFFQQFFAAWGASDGPALQRFVTPDATARTRAGLNRVLTSPAIQEARVFLPKGADPSTPYDWKTRQTTQAWVWVVWQTPGEGPKATETRGYRLQLVKTTQASSPTQEWAVRDIQGGIPDVKGG